MRRYCDSNELQRQGHQRNSSPSCGLQSHGAGLVYLPELVAGSKPAGSEWSVRRSQGGAESATVPICGEVFLLTAASAGIGFGARLVSKPSPVGAPFLFG